MSEPFLAEIKMFANNFAPRGWALCDGQLLAISQHTALFSILGTMYGGDGETTFGLPDLRGRVPIHAGTGPGLSPRRVGERGGQERVTLTAAQAAHTHPLAAASNATSQSPGAALPAAVTATARYAVGEAADATLHADAVLPAGGGQSHDNVAPYTCVNYIIALVGIFPSEN